MNISVEQAFLSMFYFLDEYYNTHENDDLGALLGSLNPYLFSGDLPTDIATLSDWNECVLKASQAKEDLLTDEEAYTAMVMFLKKYSDDFDFNLKETIDDLLQEQGAGNGSFKKTWLECIDKVLLIDSYEK